MSVIRISRKTFSQTAFPALFSLYLSACGAGGAETVIPDELVNVVNDGISEVTNNHGNDQLNTGVTTPARAISISRQPGNQMVSEGMRVELSVEADSEIDLSYQWYFEGEPIEGETSNQLVMNGVTTEQGGIYHVVISNSDATEVHSGDATVHVAARVASADALITWVAPSNREDGSGLPISEIAGYEVYYSDSEHGEMTYRASIEGAELSYVATELSEGDHYFALATIDSAGLKSDMSSRVVVNVN